MWSIPLQSTDTPQQESSNTSEVIETEAAPIIKEEIDATTDPPQQEESNTSEFIETEAARGRSTPMR